MAKIEIIGLGAGDLEQLPLGIYKRLTTSKKQIYARTLLHPVIKSLQTEGVSFVGMDDIYEKHEDFSEVYEEIIATLIEASKTEAIIYVVPGHPLLAEKTTQLLLEQNEVEIEIVGGQSYLDDLFTALRIDPIEGFQFLDATAFSREQIMYTNQLIFCQVYDQFVASHLKLTLLEDLPENYEVVVAHAVGTSEEKIEKTTLENLDRNIAVSNLTSVYVPPVSEKLLHHQFQMLRSVIRTLRGPEGCAWDRKQTHETLRKYAIEEVYELIDAIDREDDDDIIEELGDVLLQVMLHSQIGEDNGYFTIDDVIYKIVEKMIHRHPHVFNKEAPEKSWEQLKQEERGGKIQHLLDSVVMAGPSLQVAEKVQKKAATIGFDWEEVDDVWDKLTEEIAEFHEAEKNKDEKAMEEEFGDMLFVMANIARFYNVQPELALRKANEKFKRRFTMMEKNAEQLNWKLNNLTLEQLDQLWEEVKRKE